MSKVAKSRTDVAANCSPNPEYVQPAIDLFWGLWKIWQGFVLLKTFRNQAMVLYSQGIKGSRLVRSHVLLLFALYECIKNSNYIQLIITVHFMLTNKIHPRGSLVSRCYLVS